jgi:cation:H+ antiporter
LTVGGDLLVRGSVRVAVALNVSRLLIGITLVGFGTSLPELVTSVRAALLGSPGIAVGNIVGSNTANLLLVVGVAAMIYPLAAPREALMRNGGMVALATAVLVGITMYGTLDRMVGIGLVALLLVYFVYSFMHDKKLTAANGGVPVNDLSENVSAGTEMNVLAALFMAALGTGMVILGARWLVDSSLDLARTYDVSETVIGLTIVAVGTSLPELVTTVIAAIRKETAIGVGNVLGSNIQNIFGILGITAIIETIEIPREIARLDIWIMAGATAIFLIFARTNWQLGRFEGLLLVLFYFTYVALLAYLNMDPPSSLVPAPN